VHKPVKLDELIQFVGLSVPNWPVPARRRFDLDLLRHGDRRASVAKDQSD